MRLFRKSKKKNNQEPLLKTAYLEKCIDAAIIINQERERYFENNLSSLQGDARSTYKVVNRLLDKEFGSNVYPNGESDASVADKLAEFFDSKVRNIYAGIEDENSTDSEFPDCGDGSGIETSFSDFSPIDDEDLVNVIKSMPDKSCPNDPIPTWLFKKCLPHLLNITSMIVNMSLSGTFPSSLKEAIIRPGLKKSNLDSDDLKNYRPISNLTFISKLIEKCAHIQLTKYIEDNKLFANLQSGYRKFHSCETAVTRIHNDLLCVINSESNALLLLLDLSAAFDTVNHSLLISRLKKSYGIGGAALK